MTCRRKCRKLLAELAAFIEQFTRAVAFHPRFQLAQMLGILQIGEWDLMCAPSALDRLAVHEFRSSPTLRRAEHDHGPKRPLYGVRRGTGCFLDLANLRQDCIQRLGQALMHQRGDVAFHEMRLIAVAADQVGQLPAADTRQHGRICDLEPVEMKDRKNRAITCGIEKLVGMPTCRECTRLRLAVTDDASDYQIGIVESCAMSVDQ